MPEFEELEELANLHDYFANMRVVRDNLDLIVADPTAYPLLDILNTLNAASLLLSQTMTGVEQYAEGNVEMIENTHKALNLLQSQ